MLMSWMVAMGRFGEVEVEVWRDVMVIGMVRIRKRVREDANSDS